MITTSNIIDNTVHYNTITGEAQSDSTIKFILTHEQYFYIKDSLEKAYHKRAYIRDYKREIYNSKDRGHPVNLALLLYMNDAEVLEPSAYYKQIRAYLVDTSVVLQTSLEQAYYIQEILQRRYNRDVAVKGYRKAKRPDAVKRVTKRCSPILVAIPGQN